MVFAGDGNVARRGTKMKRAIAVYAACAAFAVGMVFMFTSSGSSPTAATPPAVVQQLGVTTPQP
jgi:hypothetical protein